MAPVETDRSGLARRLRELVARQILDIAFVDDEVGETLGLGLTYLAASGVNIWLARRRDKGRPAPAWERLWAATVWGQPAGIAAAATVSLIAADVVPALATWLAVIFAFLALAIRLPADRLSSLGRLATGTLMLLAVAAHFALRGGIDSTDAMVWIVNAVFVAGGAPLLLPGPRTMGPVSKTARLAR